MIDLAHEPPFSLGAMQVQAATREVQLGSNVESLEPRVMQVLVTLARQRGRVVSRRDLIEACWEGRVVSDDALNRCIGAIRRLSLSFGGFSITTIARVGYRLDAVEPETPSVSDGVSLKSERRQLTALVCQLRSAAELDPEQERVSLRGYRNAVSEIITALGGHVEAGHATSVLAYFGYPRAWEDAADRAVRAAFAIRERAAQSCAVKIGLHAAVVLVEHTPEHVPIVVGEAAELATRVLAEASPGDILITGAVHDLVADCVTVERCRALSLDDRTQALYRALALHARTRGRSRPATGLTPFVGREEPLHLLLSRLNRACAGEGQLVLILGESGIGKSRLMSELKARVQNGEQRWLECGGAPLFANTPFHAVAEMLESALGLRDQGTGERVQILQSALERAGLRPSEAVPLLAELLNLPVPERFAPLMFSPDQRRKRQFAALLGWIFGLTRDQPLVLVIEDLHWVDPSTLELIEMLAAQGATPRLLLLCTARPELVPPWAARAHHALVALDRLSVAETSALVGEANLPAEAVDLVVQRSDGSPLFAEELTRLMLERGQRPGAREIPATLRDSLCARLDRLGQAREVAQLSAGIGREFSYELLHALSPLPEAELQSALTRLSGAVLIYQRGLPPEANYRFRHTLIQEAALEMLVKSERSELHARIAHTITDAFPQLAAAQPELLARHWAEAGKIERAIASWVQVATAARSRQAHAEAEEGYRRALDLLAALPESAPRDLREAELVSELGSELQIMRGGAAPETVAALARSRALLEKSGDFGRQTALLLQSCLQSIVTGNIRDADRLAERLVELAEREGSDEIRAKAHQTRFFTLYYLGDALGAERHFGIWKQIWESGGYVQTYRVRDGLSYASLRALLSGRFELARERLREASEYAAKTRDPYEIAAAHIYKSFLHSWLGEYSPAEAAASAGVAACESGGFAALASIARVALGFARALLDRAAADSIRLMRDGLSELIRLDYRLPVGGLSYLLAEALDHTGEWLDGLAIVNDALSFNLHELAYRPHGLLIRGNLRLKLGQLDLAEADFRDSIAIARTTDAKMYELRAAYGCARMLRARGDVAASREVLAPICASFQASAAVSHVRDALSLLDELNA